MKNIICNSCNSSKNTQFIKSVDRLHKISKETFTTVKCNSCGLVYLNPQPSLEELVKYYPDDYGPYNSLEMIKYGPFSNFLRKIFKKNKVDDENIKASSEKAINFLDFGCGGGNYLDQIKKQHPNWNLYGLDNSEYACKKIKEKGFNVFCGNIDEIEVPKNFFDRVYLGQVIEHLNDPKMVLKEINSLIKKDGEIVIATPNIDSIGAKVFKSFWYALDLPRHLYLFSPKTLSSVLEDTGFEVTNVEYDVSPKIDIRSIYYLLGKKDLRINIFVWRLFMPIGKIISKLKYSGNMVITARKL